MSHSSTPKGSITEKDAEHGISVLAASGLLIDDLTDMYRGADSRILNRLGHESMHDLGDLHKRMTAFVEAMYDDMGKTTFRSDMKDAERVRMCNDDEVTPIHAYTDCVSESSDNLLSSLRDMIGSENPLISYAALNYMEDAGRIVRRLNNLVLSVRIAQDNSEETTAVPSRGVKPK